METKMEYSKVKSITSLVFSIITLLFCLFNKPGIAQTYNYDHHSDDWETQITLYGWLIGQEGTITVKGESVDASLAFEKFYKSVNWASSGYYEAKKDKLAIIIGGFYANILHENDNRKVNSYFWIINSGVGYEILKSFEVIGGGRYLHFDAAISEQGKSVSKRDKDLFSPYLGGRYTLKLARLWSFRIKGDIGGFGLGPKFSWNTVFGFIFRPSNFSLIVGYRARYVNYKSGSGDNLFKYDVLSTGPGIGFRLHF